MRSYPSAQRFSALAALRPISGALAASLALSLTVASGAVATPTMAPSTDSPALSSTNTATVTEAGVSEPLAAREGFRVLPYLQRPGATHMQINFFSETGTAATVTVKGPGLPTEGRVLEVNGVNNPATEYQTAELERKDFTQPGITGEGLVAPQGSWLRANALYKYEAYVDGLTANSKYSYTVTLDGYQHQAQFTTNKESGVGVTSPVHLVVFSDTETDPVGRVTYREWVKSPLVDGSEPRPNAEDSAWASRFGTNKRDGELQLRYALTEDMGQRENNRHIKAADPDLLLIAGDIAERASWQTHWDEWFRYFAGDEGALLDEIPTVTSPGNHEVYGYCNSADDCTPVVRARALYNWFFDTNADEGQQARDAYHRTDHGPVTILSIDSTNGTDQVPASVPDEMKISGNDSTLTPEQYGTDTQNNFTIEQYARDFPIAVANGWWGDDADPTKPDQPNFMPGSEQYAWLEAQLADARAKGQVIIVQYHHVAYSNGTHGTTMGHEYVDSQPGTPMRHLQPLFEQYNVAAVFSGHDETFQASYVDEAADGAGVYHWDVGVASDGLRGEKMIKNPEDPDGPYIPLDFNTHSVWMAQRDEPEMWKTDSNGVPQLVSGGKHYGHLDVRVEPYTGGPLENGVTPAATMVMQPMAVFPVLNSDYSLKHTEKRVLNSGRQVVYLDAQGRPIEGVGPVSGAVEEPTGATHNLLITRNNTMYGARTEALTLPAGADVFAGDWDGDGVDTLGYRVGNKFVLDAGEADEKVLHFGRLGDEILIGDWDGNGTDTLALRRGTQFFVSNTLEGGNAEISFWYGRPADTPFAGDFNGDKKDTIAVRRGNIFYVRNSLETGWADAEYAYGRPSDEILVGDANGGGSDTIAVRRGNTYYFRYSLTGGWADQESTIGSASDQAILADWDGNGTDTLGLVSVR